MKIVIISQWYSEGMGYAENMLPKALARLGHKVYLVTSTAQIYYEHPNYKEIYEPFIGPNLVQPCEKETDNFILSRLPLYKPGSLKGSGPGISGLMNYLNKIKPDIIQVFEISHVDTYNAVLYCKKNKCILISECHTHKSVLMPDAFKPLRFSLKNVIISFYTKKRMNIIANQSKLCYAIAPDVAEVIQSLYNFPKEKIKIQSLGVDCDVFNPIDNEQKLDDRKQLRHSLDINENNILCIYTGRFTRSKNPHSLASAINILHQQGYKHYKAIFLGNGNQEDIDFINSQKGCKVLPFVPLRKLVAYYRASDIGVWPREESTSQLDAVACGLPIIISDKVTVFERVDGNGLLYKEGDAEDLAEKILSLDEKKRQSMSYIGIKKIREFFSWDALAKERIKDYEELLKIWRK